MNLDKDKLAYNGGSMTTFGARDFCLKVNDMIEGAGLSVYTPTNNKKINDKETLGNKDIARMKVAKDSEDIINSNEQKFNVINILIELLSLKREKLLSTLMYECLMEN